MRPVMRYHGAKWRLAHWLMQFFPAHHTYVEPFGGAAGVLIQKPRSHSEVYNDLDDDIVNVFQVLRDPEQSVLLSQLVALTPYSRSEFKAAYSDTDDPIERARRTLVRALMGFGSAGATKHRTGFRQDSGRNTGLTVSNVWAEYPELIQHFCQRLQGVLIENRPALSLIPAHDRPDTLFYIDPPYLSDTRVMGSNRYYRHEMTDQDHEALLIALQNLQGMVVLSGYDHALYNDSLPDWQRHQTTVACSSRHGSATRTECVWLNPACVDQQAQLALFA